MNSVATLIFLACASALLALPRRWATLPLLLGACYTSMYNGVDLGGFYFTVLRLLVAVGVLRILLRGERPAGGLNRLDGLVIAWAVWVVVSSAFHQDASQAFVYNMGMVYNTCGLYFLIRCFCESLGDVAGLVKMTALVLLPVSIEMLIEQLTGRNMFSMLGGVVEAVGIRDGQYRAQGPFMHPILAGTVGAVCLPMMVGIWRRYPRAAKLGVTACVLMVVTSASSGPVLSLMFGVLALLLWRWRHLTRQMRIAAICGYILLEIVMKAPAYYLMARIDLTGSSSGWHRARLIQTAFGHLGEWWFAGTDYTRHWMPYGVPFSESHADITNHYLAMGIHGGLPLVLLFIAMLWCAFRFIGQALRAHEAEDPDTRFLVWSLGAGLFTHAVTCISVAYFDQSLLFLNLNLAAAGSIAFADTAERVDHGSIAYADRHAVGVAVHGVQFSPVQPMSNLSMFEG